MEQFSYDQKPDGSRLLRELTHQNFKDELGGVEAQLRQPMSEQLRRELARPLLAELMMVLGDEYIDQPFDVIGYRAPRNGDTGDIIAEEGAVFRGLSVLQNGTLSRVGFILESSDDRAEPPRYHISYDNLLKFVEAGQQPFDQEAYEFNESVDKIIDLAQCVIEAATYRDGTLTIEQQAGMLDMVSQAADRELPALATGALVSVIADEYYLRDAVQAGEVRLHHLADMGFCGPVVGYAAGFEYIERAVSTDDTDRLDTLLSSVPSLVIELEAREGEDQSCYIPIDQIQSVVFNQAD